MSLASQSWRNAELLQGLSFLYFTTTILRPRPCCRRQQRRKPFSTTSSPPKVEANGTGNHEQAFGKPEIQNERSSFLKEKERLVARNTTAQKVQSKARGSSAVRSRNKKASTMTAMEKDVFKNIFASLARGDVSRKSKLRNSPTYRPDSVIDHHHVSSPLSRPTPTDQSEGYGVAANFAPKEDPPTATGRQGLPALSEEDREHIQRYPKSLRSMAARAMLLEIAQPSSTVRAEDSQRALEIEQGHSEHSEYLDIERLDREDEIDETSLDRKRAVDFFCATQMEKIPEYLIDAAKISDRRLWDACEQHVFNLPTFLEGDDVSSSSSLYQDTSYPDQGFSITQDQSLKHLPADMSHLPIITTLYPALILTALRLFTAHYPISPYVSALLPRLRCLGAKSYVLGTSTSLYNTLLAHRWDVYSDLNGMEALLEEMESGGIAFDADTAAILERVRAERMEDERRDNEHLKQITTTTDEHKAAIDQGLDEDVAGEQESSTATTDTASTTTTDKPSSTPPKSTKARKARKARRLLERSQQAQEPHFLLHLQPADPKDRRASSASAPPRAQTWWQQHALATGSFDRLVGSGGWRSRVMEGLREGERGSGDEEWWRRRRRRNGAIGRNDRGVDDGIVVEREYGHQLRHLQ